MAAAPENTSPQLDAPGAGLPTLELLASRAMFALYRRGKDRVAALNDFSRYAELLRVAARSVDTETGSRPVLIKRVFSIEDSSRFWSPYMVLHHLVIVDSSILKVIESLVAGIAVQREARIADVKPSSQSGPEMLEKFDTVCADYAARITKISDLNSTLTHRHPWFGPLNAHGWNCLAAVHHGVHLRQLNAILAAASPKLR
ncbi:MAG: DinB family protein [Deltaproteobacteria bacterium]|nr:DinB family protein [Deltaproteobacteria bacterium]